MSKGKKVKVIGSKIHFLMGTVPAINMAGMSGAMNWASDHGFEIVNIVTVLLMAKTRVIGQPSGPPGMAPTAFIYCATTERDFQEYFGEPYDEENIEKYPKMIAAIEGAAHTKEAAQGS